ncbi:hypothetical protein [Candidatus Magnetobacterium casense]|uniref:Replication protein n=1 Tax=Candidatus Magnetobacterium casense TaxID=1455061 RepID=A0ABS6S4N9_9BACT|nr:hypothetical protein [Candidatus Magnetobacterium casensis]MBV6343329.1 hypothetical protein [Candidatus Magnetobacterium casensis]
MDYQIRLRTDVSFHDIIYIKDWLSTAQRGFAFEHNKPGNHHYHIYLFNIQRTDQALRDTLYKYTKDKSKYSVKTTAGKHREKILPIIAWQYGTEDDLKEPVWMKGFDDEAITGFTMNAKSYYEARNKKDNGALITHEDHYVVRPDRVWERLSAHRQTYANLSIDKIKNKMMVEWLNNGKAIPRGADLHRYAVSLYYINKHDGIVPDDAFE